MLFRSTEFARAVFFAAIVAGSSLPASAAAITLDLTKTPVQWTNSGGSYSASFDVDAANAGNDVTIRLSFVGGAQMVNGSPSVGANGINLNVWTNANASLRIDFDFHYTAGVTDLKVMTNDVDLNAMGQMEELRALYSSFGTSGQQALGIQCCSTGAQSCELERYADGLEQSGLALDDVWRARPICLPVVAERFQPERADVVDRYGGSRQQPDLHRARCFDRSAGAGDLADAGNGHRPSGVAASPPS
jgi:hypothetical protein